MQAEEKNADGEIVTRKFTFAEFQQRMKSAHGDDCFERATKPAQDSEPTFRVTAWTPYEISLASIPADATVGIGRTAGINLAAAAQTKTEQPKLEKKIMTDIVIEKDHAAEEKARVISIRALAQAYEKYGAKETYAR